MVVGLQIVMIVVSHGDVTLLANMYAFGVIWSFVLNGVAVLVLRYTQPEGREFKVPVNLRIGKTEIPIGVASITLVLLSIAIVNLFTKPTATVAGVVFSGLLYTGFEISEKRIHRKRQEAHVELDRFNLAPDADLTNVNVGVEPGNVLVPVSTSYTLYPLEAAIRRAKRRQAEIVVLHVRMLGRGALGEYDLAPEQLFSTIEQLLFTKVLAIAEKEGKPVRLAVAAGNDLWEAVLRTAANLESSSIVAGSSSKMSINEQARQIGITWERMAEPRPRVTLELFTPSGQEQIFYLGPHAPRLTAKEIDILHKVWLDLSDHLPGEEIHHHDIVHFALNEVEREIAEGNGSAVLERLREHLRIKCFHPLAGERPGVLDLLFSDTPELGILRRVIHVGGPGMKHTPRTILRLVCGVLLARVVELLGFFLRIQVIEIAEPFIEAMHSRQVLVAIP